MQPKQYKFLDSGSPLITTEKILRRNVEIRILNPDNFLGECIEPGALARIHSTINNNKYLVWIYDDNNNSTIQIELPLGAMGRLFRQKSHGIFGHFA